MILPKIRYKFVIISLYYIQYYISNPVERVNLMRWNHLSLEYFLSFFELPCPLQKRCAPATMKPTLINPPQLQVQSQLGSLSSYTAPPPA